jgi:16S rRNA (cytosine967-C5)-methyltransferase
LCLIAIGFCGKSFQGNVPITATFAPMKLHPNLLTAVTNGLKEILLDKKQADVVVENIISSNRKWGSRDRNFIADNIYNIIRYKRLYEFCGQTNPSSDSYPTQLLSTKLILEGLDLPGEFGAGFNKESIFQLSEEAKATRKLRESIPDWLDELGEQALNGAWDAELAALNTRARLCIRVNELKTTKQQLMDLLNSKGIAITAINRAPEALVIDKRRNFKNNEGYKEGLFEIQDVSSQMVAPMLDVKPGMQVIDACAGAGGKTLHVAALMHNSGSITAMDISESKLLELQARAQRAGVTIISTQAVTDMSIDALKETADRLLLDVPCSGLGVLRRKPDAKWQLTPEFLKEVTQLQAQLLDSYSTMLKSGGVLVYSTCSILPQENEEQIRSFIERQKEKYALVEEKKISAAESGFDGFYIAKLEKK